MATVDTVRGRYSSYQLLHEVGRGGSALVYRAQDLATRKEVAVKQLFGNKPQDMEDWLREVDALHTLNSRHCLHVVQYLDHMQQHDRLFLVEEISEHGSLLRLLRQRGRLAEAAACRYVYQVLTALVCMAQSGVVHGDLKASNVLLFDGDVVKLTDFALRSRGGDTGAEDHGEADRYATAAPPPADASAVVRGGGAATGDGEEGGAALDTAAAAAANFRGSAYWAAPEVLCGASRPTTASDVWSVGCLVVELLTGTPPHFDRAVPNAIHRILSGYYDAVGYGGAAASGARASAGASTVGSEEGQRGQRRKRGAATAAAAARDAASSSRTGSSPVLLPRQQSETARCSTPAAAAAADAPGAVDDAASAVPRAETSLLPPLPADVHLSDACSAFLALCFRARAADRPSASELLHHPWLLDCAVPQLLRAAREGRVMNAGVAGEEGATTTAAAAGDRFAVIEQWVERNLVCGEARRCEAWLASDALPLLVPVLTPRIMTPKYIGCVMQSFAQVAESDTALAPLFLDRLGATELWTVEELTSACDADHLATLYRRCCAVQDTQVPAYTPTDPRALRFVLALDQEKALACVRALHTRLVAESTPRSARERQDGDERQRARERLLSGGGAAVLCAYVEAQCTAALLCDAAPTLEWSTANLLLDVLSTIEPLPGGQALLWGIGADLGESRSGSSAAGGGLSQEAVTLSATVAGSGGPLSLTGSTGGIGGHTTSGSVSGPCTAWVTSTTWLLAVQEAARHLCEAAVRLLTRYVPVACASRAAHLEKAGVSLTATLVFVVSSESVRAEVRCAAAECLPLLQANSPRAARYLRDPVRCVALLGLALKRSYGAHPLTASLLAALTAVTLEKQMLAACSSCPWVWEALLHLLRQVEAAATAAEDDEGRAVAPSRASTTVGTLVDRPDAAVSAADALTQLPGVSSSSSSGGGSAGRTGRAAAVFADVVLLLLQWTAAGSPAALLSGAAAAAAAAVAGTVSPHGRLPPSPPLPPLLRALHHQLASLSQKSSICHGDAAATDVAAVLRHLALLEAAATAAATPSQQQQQPASVAALV
ncbi:protein kinase [Novymonas esmeraldas]|uniref:Protein kinase n=1 Tax=Novymonas esmeraldas TaxID=1808958 RepID=A0AAW0F4T4_9TRYP